MTVSITPFLRSSLILDAAMSGAAALLMIGGAAFLAPFLALPQPLLFWAGIVLLPWTVALVVVSRRASIPRLVLLDVIGINALWVVASFGILAAGLIQPNLLGIGFVTLQAIAVGAFAVLQFVGLRRQAEGLTA